tara:strand:- start:557 stop:1168 length:612 start_codon:yes stop_codon:yes gene_type:complete
MDPKILAAFGVLCLCLISSSFAASMGSSDDTSAGDSGGESAGANAGANAGADAGANAGAGTSEYVYDVYIVGKTANADHGSVIGDLKVDGNRVSKDNVTFHILPSKYDCQHDTDPNYNCAGEMGYMDKSGAITMAAWDKHNPIEKFFTITSPTKLMTMEISFHRPTYAPALMIEENGVEILRDDSNGGNEGSPSPFPVTYTIP